MAHLMACSSSLCCIESISPIPTKAALWLLPESVMWAPKCNRPSSGLETFPAVPFCDGKGTTDLEKHGQVPQGL